MSGRMTETEIKRTRQWLLDDFSYFAQMLTDPAFFDAVFHTELCRFLQHSKKDKLVVLPRTYLKTTVAASLYGLWRATKDVTKRILFTSNTTPNAAKTVRSVRSIVEQNELYHLFFPECVPVFSKVRWSDSCACLARPLDFPEGTFESAGIGSNIIRRHYNIIIEDDTVAPKKDELTGEEAMPSKDDIEKAVGFHKLTIPLLINEEDERIVIGCLVKDSSVLMSDGKYKNINKVCVGDEVISFDKGKCVYKKVEAMIPQGKALVFQLTTNNSKIKATGTHPFLLWNGAQFKFVPLSSVKVGDFVTVFVKKFDGIAHAFNSGLTTDNDLMWLIGYMFGDGWVSVRKSRSYPIYYVFVAEGMYPELNEKVKRLYEYYFGGILKERGNRTLQVVNKEGGELLHNIGLSDGAKNKKIPDWVFSLPYLQRRSFIQGLLDADGWELDKGCGYGIELSNQVLIEQLKLLGITSGFSSSNVFHRERMIKAPSSKEEVLSMTWHLFLYPVEKQHNKDKRYNATFSYLPLSPEFGLEVVKEIKEVGIEEVFDLTIADTFNFVANGLVVHNTRWASYDLINYVMENEKFDTYDRPCMREDGSPLYKRFSQKRLDDIRIGMGIYMFSMLYQNKPLAKEFMAFNPDWFRYYEEEEMGEDGDGLVTVDPADPPTGRASQDYSAMVAVKHTKKGLFVRGYRHKRVSDKQMIDETFDLADQNGFIKIRIEVNRYAHLAAAFREEMKRRNKYYYIDEVKAKRINKEARIKNRLSPLFENGIIFLKRGMREMEAELTTFPYGRHDDLIDALSWQVGERTSTEYEKEPYKRPALPTGRRVFTLDEIRQSCRQRYRAPYPFQRQTELMPV